MLTSFKIYPVLLSSIKVNSCKSQWITLIIRSRRYCPLILNFKRKTKRNCQDLDRENLKVDLKMISMIVWMNCLLPTWTEEKMIDTIPSTLTKTLSLRLRTSPPQTLWRVPMAEEILKADLLKMMRKMLDLRNKRVSLKKESTWRT